MSMCSTHPFEYAVGNCACCGAGFCPACLGELLGERYCPGCRRHNLALLERFRQNGGSLDPAGRQLRHSAWGVASLSFFLVTAAGMALMIGYAVWIEATQPGGVQGLKENSRDTLILGFLGMSAFCASGAGIVGGVISLFETKRRRGLGIAGLVLNLLVVFAVLSLAMIGAAAR